jgi:membrane peptidoglycan carboxypeptidase
LEEDTFKAMWRAWSRLGYPFGRLVPSYATAIGVSGDTPAALTELMGIIINDGVRYPRTVIRQLRFAENTPMETVLQREPNGGERVLSSTVARLVRQELMRVVQTGTARRACCVLRTNDGKLFPLGGKTGTGDNRVKIFARGQLRESRAVNRTAVFLFMIGDRFFGTVMVFVPGNIASKYEFTSSLPVQIFKDLEPTLKPLLAKD